MRCRACNGTMAVIPSKHGGFEDLCANCRRSAFSSEIDEDYLRSQNYDSCDLSRSISPLMHYIEIDAPLDTEDWQDSMERMMDRNHEVPDLFDNYEE